MARDRCLNCGGDIEAQMDAHAHVCEQCERDMMADGYRGDSL